MTLTEFLLARIAEDEELLRVQKWNDCDNPAHWDNDRLRAECAAKRAVVEILRATEYGEVAPDAWVVMKGALGVLAAVHSEHPDFKAEWRQ